MQFSGERKTHTLLVYFVSLDKHFCLCLIIWMSKLTSWCAAYLKTRRIFCVLLPKIFTCTCSLIVRHLKKKLFHLISPRFRPCWCVLFLFFWNFLLFHWIWLLLLARARCDGMCSVNHWIFFSNHHYYSPSFVFNAWIYKTYAHGVLLLYRYHWFWKKKGIGRNEWNGGKFECTAISVPTAMFVYKRNFRDKKSTEQANCFRKWMETRLHLAKEPSDIDALCVCTWFLLCVCVCVRMSVCVWNDLFGVLAMRAGLISVQICVLLDFHFKQTRARRTFSLKEWTISTISRLHSFTSI